MQLMLKPSKVGLKHNKRGLNMRFGIDFDDTTTKDPGLWRILIGAMRRRDHEVYIVTARLKTLAPEELDPWRTIVNGVFFTEWKAKGPFMDAIGLHCDVIIDDLPSAWIGDWDGQQRSISEVLLNEEGEYVGC